MPKLSEAMELPQAADVRAQEPAHDVFRAPVEAPSDGAAIHRANVERHHLALSYLAQCAALLQSEEPDKAAALQSVTDALPAAMGHEGLAAARATVAFCLHLLSIGADVPSCVARLSAEAASIRRTLSHLGEGERGN